MKISSPLLRQTVLPNRPWCSDNADIGKLAKGAGISLVGKGFGRACHLLGQVTIARLLGPEAFGLYAIGWTILRIAGAVSPLGLSSGVIRYSAHYRQADYSRLKGVLIQSFCLALFSGLLIGGYLYFVAPWLAVRLFRKPSLTIVIRLFAPALVLYSGLRVASSATQVSQRMQYSVSAEDIVQPLTNWCFLLVFYVLGWRLLGAVMATVISFGVALSLALYYVKHLFPVVFDRRVKSILITKELLIFSLPASSAGIFIMLDMCIDRLLVGHFLPAAEVGIYHTASQVTMIFAIILGAFNAIFAPMIADLYHSRKIRELDELFKVSTKWGLYLSLPLFLVIVFMPREVLTVIFGSRYESGWAPLVVLAVGQLINVGTGAVGNMLVMTGNQNRWFVTSSVALMVNIVLAFVLIPWLGLVGAALSTACAVGALFVVGLWHVREVVGIWPYDRRYLKGIIATMLTVIALHFLGRIGFGVTSCNLLVILMLSGLAFGITLSLLGFDVEDWEVILLCYTRVFKG